jgi:ribosomal-protein-alanine N-acetyltransferase
MEKTQYLAHLDTGITPDAVRPSRTHTGATTCNWREQLPEMIGRGVTLRELRLSDAASLCELLTRPEVARFISQPPASVAGFESFILWAEAQRAAGQYVCFAVVPDGYHAAVGVFQIRQLEPGFATAEWGFAIGSQYWGLGVFEEGAELVIDFAFTHIGTHRLEARAATANGRGNGALAKIGAAQECVLRRSFLKDGKYVDQNLWTIIAEDWKRAKAIWGPRVH